MLCDGVMVEHCTSIVLVVSSLSSLLQEKYCSQVSLTPLTLLPSTVICYWPKDGDALWLRT